MSGKIPPPMSPSLLYLFPTSYIVECERWPFDRTLLRDNKKNFDIWLPGSQKYINSNRISSSLFVRY